MFVNILVQIRDVNQSPDFCFRPSSDETVLLVSFHSFMILHAVVGKIESVEKLLMVTLDVNQSPDFCFRRSSDKLYY